MKNRSPLAMWLVSLLALAWTVSANAPEGVGPQLPKASPAQTAARGRPAAEAAADAIRLNNLGVAYMNQQRFELALRHFRQAAASHPRLHVARLNQGIALLNLQRIEPARELLLEATRRLPGNPRAWYNLGLLYRNSGQAEKAREAFAQAAQLDPHDPDIHYFLGTLDNQLQKYEQAIGAFERALALDPLHVSAEFGLARAWQRAGDPAKARAHLARFQKLTQEKLGAPMSLAYGDQGVLSLAEQVTLPAGTVPPAIPIRFTSVPAVQSGLDFTHVAGNGPWSPNASGACVFDFDNDGRSDLFLLNGGEKVASALYRNTGGRFVEAGGMANLDVRGDGMDCAAGDMDNDGWTDLVVGFPERLALYRNDGKGKFHEVTSSAGLRADGIPLALRLVDYDHDGDLDLFVSADARTPQSVLWRNNGNGTFTDWTAQTGLAGGLSLAAVATDFNNDRAIDLATAGPGAALAIFLNPREGLFQRIEPWPAPMLASASGVVVFDFNKDGWMDLAHTHFRGAELSLWRNVGGKRLEPVALPEFNWTSGYELAALDFDNDGWIDLAAIGEAAGAGQVRVLRNLAEKGFQDVTASLGLAGLKLARPRALVTSDYDSDGDTDLLVMQNGGPPVLLRNDGGNKNHWMRVSLRGLADNKSAIGTKVEVFAGTLYQKFEVQVLGDLLIGLGGTKQADIVRLLWPTGVVQDEVHLAARKTHPITEIDRRGSSCPILFAWNGTRHEFLADMIGAGIVGHWVAPGERNTPDPTEYLKVEGTRVRPRGGVLSFRFVEPMEEVVYLDQVRLLAVDHPADMEVYPHEYFASGPPFPAFRLIESRGARPPQGAWDDRGRDVLAELRHRDRRFVTGFRSLPFKGFAELHHVELDLGAWDATKPLRLLLHGFTDYFTATSVYAAHQARVKPVVPFVEAQDATGRWKRVMDDAGFPAGLRRTMVTDLTGRLHPDTRRIRIRTNLKVYWDQILMDTTTEEKTSRLTEAPLLRARLTFRGFPREVAGNPSADLSYVYEEVSQTGPYARHAGNYTRFGDVAALLERSDDQFVIFGSGEEIGLEFAPSGLPALPAGWKRDYLFFADGFSKDMDFYAAHGDTVEPLPFHRMSRYSPFATKEYSVEDSDLNYMLDTNARHVSGRLTTKYRFEFPRKKTR